MSSWDRLIGTRFRLIPYFPNSPTSKGIETGTLFVNTSRVGIYSVYVESCWFQIDQETAAALDEHFKSAKVNRQSQEATNSYLAESSTIMMATVEGINKKSGLMSLIFNLEKSTVTKSDPKEYEGLDIYGTF